MKDQIKRVFIITTLSCLHVQQTFPFNSFCVRIICLDITVYVTQFLCEEINEIQDGCCCFPAVCAMDIARPPVCLLDYVPNCWPTC